MPGEKILLVDDEPPFVKTIQFFLKAHDYEVIVAVNGREALEKVEEDKPDLILLDVMMPEMDGIDVCQQLNFW